MVDNVKVQRLPPDIIGQFYDGEVSFPVIVYGGIDGDKVIAAGGLLWRDGRCCGWVDVFTDISSRKITLVRWCKRMLRMASQIGETEVYIVRDANQPNSAKLLRILGFEFVELQDGTGREIYRVRV